MTVVAGLWLPHTSSVDFCEANYLLDYRVAEPFNAITSLAFISLPPVLGLLYSNPLNETRFRLQYWVMIICGVGSALLHGTLKATFQASDELPMLYMNTLFLFTFMDLPARAYSGSALHGLSMHIQPLRPVLPVAMFSLAALQTVLYFHTQQIYAVFIVTYSLLVAMVVLLSHHFAKSDPLLSWLFWRSILSYLVVGFGLWVLDMQCSEGLKALYASLSPWTGGMTLHVVWHFGASLGTFLEVLFLIKLRSLYVEGTSSRLDLRWLPEGRGFFPVLKRVPADQAKAKGKGKRS